MKFLISIVMVLLVMNLFAQAQVGNPDNDNPGNSPKPLQSGSSTAKEVKGGNTTAPPDKNYSLPLAGNKGPKQGTNDVAQGSTLKCDENKANGLCSTSPNHSGSRILNRKGVLPGVGGVSDPKLDPATPGQKTR